MRAICNTETFGRKLQLVSRGVSARSTIQLLGGILLEAQGDEPRQPLGRGKPPRTDDLHRGQAGGEYVGDLASGARVVTALARLGMAAATDVSSRLAGHNLRLDGC